jgi:hypothetical protein
MSTNNQIKRMSPNIRTRTLLQATKLLLIGAVFLLLRWFFNYLPHPQTHRRINTNQP